MAPNGTTEKRLYGWATKNIVTYSEDLAGGDFIGPELINKGCCIISSAVGLF